ncbi:MAG TPA: sigma-70 family RNA polymerase sigma factor [Phycisphaerales bacterium]|nr:sigma-70 family RNA polymerase sigma factor [Phycisphaerales bacterium]
MPASQPQPQPAQTAHADADDAADLRIIASIKAGDSAGWSALVARYQDRVFATCVRMIHDREVAGDLAQEAFVKIIQGVGQFDGRAKFSTWVYRVTMNVCLSRLRSEKLRRHASLDAPAGGRAGGSSRGESLSDSGREREPGGRASVEADEERELVLAALRLLEPDQRAVLILCDCRGLAYEQIGEVLGVAVGTVKSRVFRARTALRDAVEQVSRERRGGRPRNAAGGSIG